MKIYKIIGAVVTFTLVFPILAPLCITSMFGSLLCQFFYWVSKYSDLAGRWVFGFVGFDIVDNNTPLVINDYMISVSDLRKETEK